MRASKSSKIFCCAKKGAAIALADLVYIANAVVNGEFKVDGDTIQDAFQDDMEREGFFVDLDKEREKTK